VLFKRLPQFWMPRLLQHHVIGLQSLLLGVSELGNTRRVEGLKVVDLHHGTSVDRGPYARVPRQQEAQVSVPRILPILPILPSQLVRCAAGSTMISHGVLIRELYRAEPTSRRSECAV
jgi:hypothetical protein